MLTLKEVVKQTVKHPSTRFKFYDLFYFCTKCQRWITKGTEKKARNGKVICPICGKALRTHPKYRRAPKYHI